MRRFGNLFWEIVSTENLIDAAKKVCSARKDKAEVARFEAEYEDNIKSLQQSLVKGTYKASKYHFFRRNEHGKERKIADLPLYPDRICHQAFANVIEPRLNTKLIDQTYASRIGHGSHKAVRQAWKYVARNPKVKYCLALDIHHCYESIDKGLLKEALARHIKDRRVLDYLGRFIDDYPDDGISIGDNLSPVFCNIFLSDIDHYAKERLHIHMYIRYADNIFAFGNSKAWLKKCSDSLIAAIEEKGLKVNANWVIADLTKEGVDFLGYRIFKDHIALRKRTKERMIRAMARVSKALSSGFPPDSHDRGTVASYIGVLKWCNSYNLYCKYVKPVFMLMKSLIREQYGFRAFRSFRTLSEVNL